MLIYQAFDIQRIHVDDELRIKVRIPRRTVPGVIQADEWPPLYWSVEQLHEINAPLSGLVHPGVSATLPHVGLSYL